MKCTHIMQDINDFFDHHLSVDKSQSTLEHIQICNDCKIYYSSLILTQRHLERNDLLTESVYSKIESRLDENQYSRRKKIIYMVSRKIYGNSTFIKSVAAVMIFCVLLAAVFMNRAQIYKFASSGINTVMGGKGDTGKVLPRKTTASPNMEEINVTIPEGYTFKQIEQLLVSKKLVDKVKFEAAAKVERFKTLKSIGAISNRLEERKFELEGYLFPEIYTFTAGMSEVEILTVMLKSFEENVTEADYEKLKTLNTTLKKNYTMDQIITMASLIERETMLDRNRVAGVFYNRLRSNTYTRFQSVTTIQYIILNRDGAYKEKLEIVDTWISDPFNTFINNGLPPGPICSPGVQSIQAALEPESHTYLFFVAKMDGSHVFSTTLPEHSKAVANVVKEEKSIVNPTPE